MRFPIRWTIKPRWLETGRPRLCDESISDRFSAHLLAQYLEGDVTHRELAERYGMDTRSIRNRITNARHWAKTGQL